MDWHPATINRRGGKLYVSMTVPSEARGAMGGQKQVKLSAKTSDPEIAKRRRHDLEAELRRQVGAAVQQSALESRDSDYQRAVRALGLEERVYAVEYDPQHDVVTREMCLPPRDATEVANAERVMEARLIELKLAELEHDPSKLLVLAEQFRGPIPNRDEAVLFFQNGIAEAKRALGAKDMDRPTILSFLPAFEEHNARRVAQETMKLKTAKARATNIKQFAGHLGDLALADLTPMHAHSYAQSMTEHGNPTIKTRISDVSTMLDYAIAKGLIHQNPFSGLKLSGYGTRTQHYSPLPDHLLSRLFSVPNLPNHVRSLWAILVCTGMRLDEAATLRADQLKSADGILYFDLRDAHVKNRSAQRRVPVCRTLEPLVADLVLGKNGRQQLFDFKINADHKTRASSVCLYWMNKANLNIVSGDAGARYTTHSLRGTFKDKMRDAGVALEIHNALLGHDLHTVASSYGRGPGLPRLKDAVDRATHPYLDWIASVAQHGK